MDAAHHLLGQTCALLAAITWASALVLFKLSGERVAPIGLNLFKNTVALILLGATLLVLLPIDPGHAFGLVCAFSWGGHVPPDAERRGGDRGR